MQSNWLFEGIHWLGSDGTKRISDILDSSASSPESDFEPSDSSPSSSTSIYTKHSPAQLQGNVNYKHYWKLKNICL